MYLTPRVMIPYQVNSWIHEKLQTATDDTYKEPTNLEGKMQKHQAFEAEISTNKARMDAVCKVTMIDSFIAKCDMLIRWVTS